MCKCYEGLYSILYSPLEGVNETAVVSGNIIYTGLRYRAKPAGQPQYVVVIRPAHGVPLIYTGLRYRAKPAGNGGLPLSPLLTIPPVPLLR